MFRYRNHDTGQVVEYPERSPRLDALAYRWALVGEPEQVEPAPAATPVVEVEPDDVPARPRASASRGTWVRYLEAAGVPAGQLEGLTRDQLVDLADAHR